MMFHQTRIKHNLNIKIYSKKNYIDWTNRTKFLGITNGNKLNWAAYIICIKNQIYKSIGII